VAEVSKEEGSSDANLYIIGVGQGIPLPDSGNTSDQWSAEAK